MLKAQVNSLKKELATTKSERVAANAEAKSTLKQMKFISIDAMLHA